MANKAESKDGEPSKQTETVLKMGDLKLMFYPAGSPETFYPSRPSGGKAFIACLTNRPSTPFDMPDIDDRNVGELLKFLAQVLDNK